MPLDDERAQMLTGLVKTPVPPPPSSVQDITSPLPQGKAGKNREDSPVVSGPGDKPEEYGEGASSFQEGTGDLDETAQRLVELHCEALCHGDAQMLEHTGVMLAALGIELVEGDEEKKNGDENGKNGKNDEEEEDDDEEDEEDDD